MRLINADELKQKVKVIRSVGGGELRYITEKDIDKAPTECEAYRSFCMAKQRPQGEWIPEYPISYTCSICNAEALDINEYPYKSNFCPNCGAEMRSDNNGKK